MSTSQLRRYHQDDAANLDDVGLAEVDAERSEDRHEHLPEA
jgi:hypothetical protein